MFDKTNSVAVQNMLSQIRAYEAKAKAEVTADVVEPKKVESSFSDLVKNAVSSVNSTQMASKDLQAAYERGENVPLTDVVLGMQKSSLAFEATLQVRNKVLEAYQLIMNMPV